MLIEPDALGSMYDYIVVGAGTAGNVVANRLTENPNISVLLIEAGGTNEGVVNSQIPFFAFSLIGTQYDWNYTTTPQSSVNNTVFPYPRGLISGGTSSINGMTFTRGSTENYDILANITRDVGWSWDHMQTYFRKNERWTEPADNHSTVGQFEPSAHGFHGITAVSLPGFPRPIDPLILQATKELSNEFSYNQDMNSGNHLGIGYMQATIDHGVRSSSATSYLAPKFLGRSNLHVLLRHQVLRLVQTGKDAFRSIEVAAFSSDSPRARVFARKDVILSAGVFGTPRVLLHSGIGDRDSLRRLGINPLHHLPSVGKNLTEHVQVANVWRVNSTDTVDSVLRNSTLLAELMDQWNRTHTGSFAAGYGNLIGFFRLPDNSTIFREVPDPAAGPKTGHYEFLIANIGAAVLPEGNYMSIVTSLLTPTSRGSLTLNSSDPLVYPLINPNILAEPFDIFTSREAIRGAFRFLRAPVWKDYILGPAGDLAEVDIDDDQQLDAHIVQNAGLGCHAAGTVAMTARDAGYGVVDPDLRVKGLNGLRVVDGSVIPFLPSAHTQAMIYAIAERASDIIKFGR
ncbi:hypothetical protein HGRIS_005284 [Hohenbuehelia grisea]|uniref:Uncharacterized protein n=1 Tax=Hohenbuehelia grisea TaxID=104357 RepID=A0ABR3JES3_9AGAR